MTRIAAALTAVTAVSLLPGGGAATRPLAAQNSLDTTFAIRSGATPRLAVSNMSGSITVQVWNRPSIRLQAEYDRAQVEAEWSTTGRLSVRTISRRGDNEVEYVLTVPPGTAVEASGISTDVSLISVCGAVNVSVVSGDVDVACAQGDVTIQTVSGDVDVSDVRGGMVDAGSTSGDVSIRNVRGTAPLMVRSVSGEIDISGVESAEVTAETVSGEVAYVGRIQDNGRYRFEAHSGDVTVRALNAFNATVTVSTFSGSFEPDFPITIAPGRQSSREWEFTVGSGSARMSLRSFSGTIALRRGAGAAPAREREDENR
jgi:hypothetical protein